MANPNLPWSCRPLAQARASVAWARAPVDLLAGQQGFGGRAKVTLKELLLGSCPAPAHLAAPAVTVTEAPMAH